METTLQRQRSLRYKISDIVVAEITTTAREKFPYVPITFLFSKNRSNHSDRSDQKETGL